MEGAEAEAEAEVEAEAEMGTPGPRGMGKEIVLHAMARVWEREREGVTRQEVYLEREEEPQQGQLQERRHQVVRLGLAQEAPEREVPAVAPVQEVEEADMVAVPQEAEAAAVLQEEVQEEVQAAALEAEEEEQAVVALEEEEEVEYL